MCESDRESQRKPTTETIKKSMSSLEKNSQNASSNLMILKRCSRLKFVGGGGVGGYGLLFLLLKQSPQHMLKNKKLSIFSDNGHQRSRRLQFWVPKALFTCPDGKQWNHITM
jgi:hypothetical protein